MIAGRKDVNVCGRYGPVVVYNMPGGVSFDLACLYTSSVYDSFRPFSFGRNCEPSQLVTAALEGGGEMPFDELFASSIQIS